MNETQSGLLTGSCFGHGAAHPLLRLRVRGTLSAGAPRYPPANDPPSLVDDLGSKDPIGARMDLQWLTVRRYYVAYGTYVHTYVPCRS